MNHRTKWYCYVRQPQMLAKFLTILWILKKKNFQRLPCHGTLLQGWEAVEVELLLQVLQGDSGLGLEHDRFNQEI